MKGDFYFEVFVEDRDWGNECHILIARMMDESILRYMTPDGKWKDYDGQERLEPTLKLRLNEMNALAKSMIEWANRKNLRTDSEQKLQGKLEATNYHLEDLRTLLKLKKR